jgi:hypothetical protein
MPPQCIIIVERKKKAFIATLLLLFTISTVMDSNELRFVDLARIQSTTYQSPSLLL